MDEHTTNNSGRHVRGLLRPAVGVTMLLLAGAACGAKAQPSSPASAASAPASPAAHGAVARTTPSTDQVAAVIAQVKDRLATSFQPTDAHVRAFGDAACSAFDQGKTAPQVRTLVLQAASQLPSITVSPATADFAVGTAVNLFCPGYADKLGS